MFQVRIKPSIGKYLAKDLFGLNKMRECSFPPPLVVSTHFESRLIRDQRLLETMLLRNEKLRKAGAGNMDNVD
jgi:hypothetical protein